MFTIVLELLKAMQPAPQRMSAAKRPETPKRRVASTVALPADLRRRQAVRALPNCGRQPRLASESRSSVAKGTALAKRLLRLQRQQKTQAG